MPSERDERTINQVLADNLAHFMGERQMTQAALALKAGIGQTTVSLYLKPDRRTAGKSGKEPSAKLAEVANLARALDVELWELLRPLSKAQREFYRSMEALLVERSKAPQESTANKIPDRKQRNAA